LHKLTILNNGLRVITKPMPAFRSVAIGVWIRAGSADENKENNGYSHFIEHMLFKGTPTRSAQLLADEMDWLGGNVNAYTSKELTCFHAKVIGQQVERAMDLLSDIIINSSFDKNELEKEKGVILEEIAMTEDTPEDIVHDLLAEAYFPETALGMPILGSAENVRNATRESLLSYKNAYYTPKNVVLSVAGGFDEETLLPIVERCFGSWQGGEAPKREITDPDRRLTLLKKKPVEQAQLCIGFKGVAQGSDELYPLTIFNSVLGGAMSSRLFQRIREQMGAAYSVYSYPSCYSSCGMISVYAGTSPDNLNAVADAIMQEIELIKREGMSKNEFEKAKEQLKTGYILGRETTMAQMNSLGRSILLGEKIKSDDEVIAKIDNTTMEDVEKIVMSVLGSKYAVAVVGNCELPNI